MVADGKPLEQVGQASVLIQVGGVCVYPTECLGGPIANAGVLTRGRFSEASWLCDRSSKIPLVGWGEAVPLQSLTWTPETLYLSRLGNRKSCDTRAT